MWLYLNVRVCSTIDMETPTPPSNAMYAKKLAVVETTTPGQAELDFGDEPRIDDVESSTESMQIENDTSVE